MQESTVKNIQATMKLHGFYDGEANGVWDDKSHASFYSIVEAASNKDIKPVVQEQEYKLSTTSLQKLKGVHPDLTKVVNRAIQITEMDFAVNEGLRTIEQQRKYVNAGKSQTMQSNHLTGRAVDLVPTPNGKMNWNDWDNYYVMAEAMQKAAEELNVKVRWGGCWEIINGKTGNPKSWVEAYGARKRKEGKKVFTDGPHFELV